ncbi:hypothetical protein TSUD_107390 [Trifolium subterraneum]|uniref:Replication protein A 70 kDa DNA-binding subunit B/D first OB fold domain-containing protein n=1 Tax=Trifolium subterraneum TaxID=3900 RepID=A0A2Z6PK85_TRISU|nr:hypothetical protein TSUD_107390 [Trifolium subterraneum]
MQDSKPYLQLQVTLYNFHRSSSCQLIFGEVTELKETKVSLNAARSSMETVKEKLAKSSMDTANLKEIVPISATENTKLQVIPSTNHDNPDGKKQALVPVADIPYDPVKKINKKKEIWRLGVIIDDIWTMSVGDKADRMDMLLRDIKGDTIIATIMESDIEFWKPKLIEQKTYFMRNFKVLDVDTAFKMTTHKFRLIFVGGTKVDEVEIPGMIVSSFKFKDFAEIQSGKYQPDLLYDAIGVIDTIKKCVTASATRKGNISFTIKDLRSNVLDCILWDALSVEFLSNYNQQNDLGHVVMIMKHAKVKEPQGVYPLQLTNAWNGTKLLFDQNIPEIKEFLACLPKDVTFPTQSGAPSNSSQIYSVTSAASQYSSDENFMKHARVVQLGDMKKLKVETYCVTLATTSHIRVSNQGWYFRSCFECSCKADGDSPPYECKKGHFTQDPQIKYKLDVEVYDGKDTAKFVFWDNTMEELLGMTAATLLQKEIEVSSSCKEMEAIQEDVVAIKDSPPKQTFTQSDIDKFACLDDSILSTPNVSASSENDISASSQKTPAKRSAGKQTVVEVTNLDSQFSSTRSGKAIKKEKK